jgi:aspartyl-tRNA synthetase
MKNINLSTGHRTHHCNELTISHIGSNVTVCGWVHKMRHLGGVVFIDIRDHYGITQLIEETNITIWDGVTLESCLKVSGTVRQRSNTNPDLHTGNIEIVVSTLQILGAAPSILPFPVNQNSDKVGEDIRLQNRFLDLRTQKMHDHIVFRSKLIAHIRQCMTSMGFMEFQTPILTSSSPEGARDFVVPSRLHPGKFYALPQAPQQFKQLLMCSGFDRYFQIAPCFRDEDPRSDRAPGEFYQLDIEMCFATQKDVFDAMETLFFQVFHQTQFSAWGIKPIHKYPTWFQQEFCSILSENRQFPCIPYARCLELFGSDKPDLRFDLSMQDIKHYLQGCTAPFVQPFLDTTSPSYSADFIAKAIHVPNMSQYSRKILETWEAQAKELGLGGMPFIIATETGWKGNFAKWATANLPVLPTGDGYIFIMGVQTKADLAVYKKGGKLRQYLAGQLGLLSSVDSNTWAFAWVVDFPMYEWNEDLGKIDFSHNPFSMPQGGLGSLQTKDPLDIVAFQYDLVVNGYELSSGAIRNHSVETMEQAFAIAGYSKEVLANKFGALWRAFQYGAPIHGGIAPGIDRMVMLLLQEPNIREVIAFPLNQKAQDVLFNAPNDITLEQKKELRLK